MGLISLWKKNSSLPPLLIDFLILMPYTDLVMTYSTHKFNEMVFQLLFSLDMGDCQEEDLIPFLMRELSMTRQNVRAAYNHARAIFDAHKEFDEEIATTSKGYDLERIGRVERNVLRFALHELSTQKEQPRQVIISEALRLTKKFSTKEAVRYVNAVLDTESTDGEEASLSLPETETAE